jgi:hypothetical protein
VQEAYLGSMLAEHQSGQAGADHSAVAGA